MNPPRHPNADTNCPDCDGYGYIFIEDETYTAQSSGVYVEVRTQPIYSLCACVSESTELDNYYEKNRPNNK